MYIFVIAAALVLFLLLLLLRVILSPTLQERGMHILYDL